MIKPEHKEPLARTLWEAHHNAMYGRGDGSVRWDTIQPIERQWWGETVDRLEYTPGWQDIRNDIADEAAGPCICDTSPNSDGPDECCPQHGRSYEYWLEQTSALMGLIRGLGYDIRGHAGDEAFPMTLVPKEPEATTFP